MVMDFSVQFNHQFFFVTVEVDYEIFNAVLSSEFSTLPLSAFKIVPQIGFGRCQIVSELLSKCLLLLFVVCSF